MKKLTNYFHCTIGKVPTGIQHLTNDRTSPVDFLRSSLRVMLLVMISLMSFVETNAQTTLISPTGDGGFENGATFAANGWTVVNGATNQFFVGTVALPSAGTNSAYISDNVAGTTYNYTNTIASTVHFYRDITFPAGETNIVLSFKWKTQGEGNYDYVTVFSVPTSTIPTVNNPAGAFQSWLNIPVSYPGAVILCTPPNLNLQGAYQTQTICLPAAYAGTSKRIVFMWSNDSSAGTQPPGSIDEISLVSSLPPVAPANSPTALVLTPFSVSQINGSFTAAAGAPEGYLTVRYPTGALPTNPVNGTTYAPGATLGLGKVVSSNATTTYSSTGLTPSTTYDFYTYSYNLAPCASGPLYKTTAPLFGTATTLSCTGLAAGTYTVGPTGTYASLTAVTAALSMGTTGPVTFELQSTYLSAVETFPITFAGTPCPTVGGITIRPQAGAVGLLITSANATGTINFDGGDMITIDGRAGGVGASQLTISNTALTGYTIQFINNATGNTVKFCTVAGVNTGVTSGVIFFNNAVGFTAGNSNITIDNCDLRDGATTPTNIIYVSGNTIDYLSQNNNCTVSNCNIHDWFNATSTTLSAGINIFNGASDWTITGNSFYQTVARVFTMVTATDEGAIAINSPTFGTNFTVTNNFIGGSAPLCAGAAWNYSGGATGTPTPKMIRLTAALGPFSNINNNTLTNFNLTSATTNNLSGLISHVSGNVNINNNTLGSQTLTGAVSFVLTNATAGVFYLPLAFGLGAVPCTMNVTNNNIGGITVNNTSTGSISFRVVYSQAVAGSFINLNNNLIGGTVANSIQQLSNNIFTGVLILNPTVGGIYTNNTVRNLTLNNIGVTGSIRGIDVQASGGGHIITGNIISNLTTNATNVAINNAASIVGITMTGSIVGGTNVSNNTIFNLTNTNTTVAGWINGMYFSTGVAPQPNTTISKNFVHSINLASVTGGMAGIFLPNAGLGLVYNNMVRLGIDAAGASIPTSLQINGIYKASSGSMGIYFNTVYIGGTGVASGAVNTYAFRRLTSGPQDTVMNNIFYNARSNVSGTGKNYAAFLNANTQLLENNNDLYVDGTGGVLGLLVATDYTTLPLWQAAANQDWNSVSADPKLINPTGTSATVDLHIQPATPTVIEQAGFNLAQVPIDFDLQTRSTLTPVDIGADAGNFLLLDVAAPSIYYTPLTNSTCSTGDRTLTGVNITDATGIPLAGTLRPRIYYKKNAGAYFSQPGTFVSGPATNSFWNFTIVAADMGGLAATDVVSYYVIAQDIVATPNIGSNPAGVVATDVNTIITPPTTPNTYTVLSVTLSGTYTVGVAGAYPTLTAAVTAYNSACLSGPVLFSLIDATYPSEAFPITINANPFASAVNTLTIKPAAGVSPSMSGTPTVGTLALIVLNGADWVTIDGSNGAVANTICPLSVASRDLTLTNLSTSTVSAVIWLQTVLVGLNAAANNTIKNINLVGSGNAQTLFGVGAGSSTVGTASLGALNNNNAYINNNISKTQYGIYTQGSTLGAKNTGTIINQNLINTVAPNNTARGGIVVGFENNIIISGNKISEIALASSPDVFGIAVGGISITTTLFTGNEVTNAVISNNVIGSVRNTGNSFSACGIFVCPAISGTNLIVNNMISGVSGNPTPGDLSVGMLLGCGNGSVTQVYYNTITMTSAIPLASSSSPSYALAIGGSNPVVDIRNNILVNTQNNGSGNNYAIGYGYTPFTNLTSDHNDYFVGAGPTFFIGGTVILSTPTNQQLLSNLQAATQKDGFGQNTLPVFISPTDLHLAATGNQCLDGEGTPIPGITTDIDCQVRSVTNPDIGADEFSNANGIILTIAETSGLFPNDGITCAGAPVTISAPPGGTYLWSTGATTQSITPSPLVTTPYSVTVTIGTCTDVGSVTITVNPLPTASISVTETSGVANNDGITCAGSSVTLTATGGVSFLWSTGATTAAITVAPTMTTVYTVTVTNANGCTATASQTITVNAVPAFTAVIVNPTSCESANGSITLTMTAGVAPFTFTWATTNGCGLVPGAQNQSGLCFGNYNLTVTDAGGCSSTGSFTLDGPDPGCFSCPTIGALAVTPGTVCPNTTVTLTASGLVGMGITYGITFVRFNAPTATPYVGGTLIATIPNAGLTGGGTTATTTTSIAVAGTYSIYAILSPIPTDPNCRPSATNTLVVNPSPNVNAVANMTYCAGSTVPSIVFTSTTPGAVFNWSRTAEAIGLGTTSGVGNVPSFTATNAGGTPLTSTFTVMASFTANGVTCTGTPITFTVTINPNPAVNAVTNMTYCAGAVVPSVVFGSPVAGAVFSWSRTNQAIGLAPLSGTGNVPSFVATNAGVTPLTSTFTVTASFTNNGVTCTGTPITFTITINPVPIANTVPNQTVCAGTNVPSLNLGSNIPGATITWSRTVPVPDIGALPTMGTGAIPAFTATNTSGAPITSTFTVFATFVGSTGSPCPGIAITFTFTVNPSPIVNPVANKNFCFHTLVPSIVFNSSVPAATINWSQTGGPNIGLNPTSGTGFIPSFLGVNNTNGPITATFTVTASFTSNGVTCTGPPMIFTITICYQMFPTILGDTYVCPGQTVTYFVGNANPNSIYTWILQNGGGVILSQNSNSITIQWGNSPGGPFILQLQETGCTNTCSSFAFAPVFIQGVEALACNDNVQISLDQDCLAHVLSGMILEGENPDNNNYFVQLTDAFGNLIPNATLTSEYLGQLITAKVINECNGQSCWGTITLEDKIPPTIQCQDATVACGSSLEPIYVAPISGLASLIKTPGSPIGPNANTITTEPINMLIPTGGLVQDVNVTIDLDHTWVGDLKLDLISPAGTIVNLSTSICGAADNWENVTLDDQALTSINNACNNTPPPAILQGSYIPNQPLSTFNGEEAGGVWQLRITDQANGDAGTLNLVKLDILYMESGPFAPVVNDACGDVDLTYTDVYSGDPCQGQILTRNWTATDPSGNSATCTQTLTIVPIQLEDVLFPPAFIGECGDSDSPDHTGWPTTIDGITLTDANDICNIFIGYWDQEINDCGGGRKIARHWTILDWCTVETLKGIQVIKLSDNEPPVLTCPDDFEVGTDFWYCYANVSVPKPGVEDNCSDIANYFLTSSEGTVVSFGSNFVINGLGLGIHTLTWRVTDECGNSSTCSFHITVVDDVVPVANCDAHTVIALTNDGPQGITLVPADVFNDGSYDNCGPVTFRARRMDSCIDFDWTTEGACIDDIPGGVPPVNSRDRGTVHRPCVPFACCDVGAGPIMVELEVTDQAGNKNFCMVEAIVQDKISPFLECPPDIIVSCDFWFNVQEGTFSDDLAGHAGNGNGNLDEDPLSPVFGNMYDAFAYNDDQSVRQDIIIDDPGSDINPQPHFWGIDGWADDNCEVNLQVRVRVVADCSGGDLPGNAPDGAVKMIERRFSASDGNDGVAPGTCTQRIWVVDYEPFYITDNTCNNNNPNDGVIWPCDVLLTNCPEDLGDTGEPTLFDDACSLIGVTYEDTRFDFVDGACFKILREWAVIDWCQYNSLTGEGLWHYTQVIKVHDSEGPEFEECPNPVTLCVADEGVSLPDNNQAFLGEDNPLSSSCSVHLKLFKTVHETCSDIVNYDVKLYLNNGDEFIYLRTTTTATVDSNNDAELYFDTRQNPSQLIRNNGIPYNSPFCGDYHRILWSVEDGCGNWSHCEYLIRLEDCKQPSPVCINGLSTVVMPIGGQVTIWAKDFNASSFDDCTPEADLLYSFSGDSYQPSYSYTCGNVPVFNEEISLPIWVADGGTDDNCNGQISWAERNKDFCTTTIVITDNTSVCDTSHPIIEGVIMTENLQPVEMVSVNLSSPGHLFPVFVTTGSGLFNFNNLVLSSDCQVTALRDDNHKNGVSTLDMVRIQKHLLGIDPFTDPYLLIAADANNSQSVSAIDLVEIRKLILGVTTKFPANTSWRFVDKAYQFGNPSHPWPFDEVIDIPNMTSNETNKDFVAVKIGDVNNSAQANAQQIKPRNGNEIVHLVADEHVVNKGDVVDLVIHSTDFISIEGYQFTLITQGLEFLGVESGVLEMNDENIGSFSDMLTASWHKVGGVSATSNDVLFTLHFQASNSGHLSKMIKLNSKETQAEAYSTSDDIMDLKLSFLGLDSEADFALYQNEPNPFKGVTVIGFDIPQAGDVTLTVFDVTGKVLAVKNQDAVKGYNTISISHKELPSVGVMYYRLDAGENSATKKMIKIE